MVQEALVRWTAAGGAGGVSVLYFADAAALADINSDVQAFLSAVRPALANTTSAVLDPTVQQRDTATGLLSGGGLITGAANIVGNGGLNAVPNAAQGLCRMGTNTVVSGRRLQGRIFIPGMASGMVAADGSLTGTAITTLTNAGNALVLGARYGIWHRPKSGSGGTFALATGGGAWSEFATQRRRRS